MPLIEITFDGKSREIEVEPSELVRAQRDVGIAADHFENVEAWHENGQRFTGADYAKISKDDERRIFELINGAVSRARRGEGND